MAGNTGKIPIQGFNSAGLSDSKWSGVENSFYKLIGIDMHSKPGIIQAEQKMTQETAGSPPDERCNFAVSSSNGAQYWFSASSGKIWERPTTGTWRLVHTTTPAAGAALCLGAAEYQGRIYWATQSRLHYITVANADDNDWATNAVEDFGTFGVTDATFHPMYSHSAQLILYIGDGNQLAQVENTTFTANVLDIKTPLRIKTIGAIGADILIGTYIADEVTKTEIIRWNGFSPSFTNSDEIPETGINAFLPADNMVLVQAGLAGNVYWYDGTNLELFFKIPGDYSPTKTAHVKPGSVAGNGEQILFAFSNVSGNPADQLIYRFARHNRNYTYILDAPYPTSERSSGEFVLSGNNYGALLVVGDDVYASVDNGTTRWIDKLDHSNKLNGAYFETRVMRVNRFEEVNMSEVYMAYASLPASTDIDFYLDINYAGYTSALSTVTDTQRNLIRTDNESREFTTLQLKTKLTTNSNDSPQIETGAIEIR